MISNQLAGHGSFVIPAKITAGVKAYNRKTRLRWKRKLTSNIFEITDAKRLKGVTAVDARLRGTGIFASFRKEKY